MEYADYSFVREINFDRYDLAIGKEIAKWMTALMNTSGGLIVLYSNQSVSDKKRDVWLMKLEDHLTTNWIPKSTYRSLIHYKYLRTMDKLRMYWFVSKSSRLITFNYNAYARHAAGTEPVRDREDVQRILDIGQGTTHTVCTSQLQEILGTRESFGFNEEMPTEYCESQSLEFKHYYLDDKKEKGMDFLASNLIKCMHKDDELLRNVSAFANTNGGSLILGVEEGEKRPVLRGFKVTDQQEQEENTLTNHLKDSLSRLIWSGNRDNQPLPGIDWDVFYHNVSHESSKLSKVIEIQVPRHSSGMFLKPPTYCVVNDSGCLVTVETFREWKEQFLCLHSVSARETKNNPVQAPVKISTEQPKGFADSSQHPSSRSPSKLTIDEPQDVRSLDVKMQKSFEGGKTDITLHDFNFHECCTDKMAKYLQAHHHPNVWYPPIEAIQRKNSDMIQYQRLTEFINSKYWDQIATVINTEYESNKDSSDSDTNVNLLCCVAIMSTGVPTKLIYCFGVNSCYETQDHGDYVRHALHHARKLKREFLTLGVNREHQSALFHFEIQVLAVPVTGPVTQLWDSEGENSPPVSYPYVEPHAEFAIACNGLAYELLKTRYTMKDRYGDILIDHLTDEQARVLLERKERVLVVTGGSGTGKTVIALHLVHDAKARGLSESEVLYICNSESLRAFVSFQVKCEAWVLKATDSLSENQREVLVRNAKLIIVDDAHTVILSKDWKENPHDLYYLMFNQVAQHKAEVAILFDPDQDYQSHLPDNFHTKLRQLAEQIAIGSDGNMTTQDIKVDTLKKNIRNSRQIARFMQANQTQAKVDRTVVWLNEREGDGVTYDYIGSNFEENGSYLDAKLRGLIQRYEEQSIVVLCDDGMQLNTLENILREKFRWNIQWREVFPAKGIVMSMLEDFGGLEAEVVLFLLPPMFGAENQVDWRYINHISARTRVKLEFLLPWDPEVDPVRLPKMKMFLELFQMVSQFQLSEIKF